LGFQSKLILGEDKYKEEEEKEEDADRRVSARERTEGFSFPTSTFRCVSVCVCFFNLFKTKHIKSLLTTSFYLSFRTRSGDSHTTNIKNSANPIVVSTGEKNVSFDQSQCPF
jgi:hypothetical protein